MEVDFAPNPSNTAHLRDVAIRARVIVMDPGHAGSVGTDIVRLGAEAGVPAVIYLDMSDASMAAILASLALGPVDVLISPLDSARRFSAAVAISSERRWPLLLARSLSHELSALPSTLAIHAFATICGASLPQSVESFCLAGGVSLSTGSRRLAKAGIPTIRRFIVGSRLVQMIDAVRQSDRLGPVSRRYLHGKPRRLHNALAELAGTTVAEVRCGLPAEDIVSRVATAIRTR
jgi:hypothetical protein